MSSSIIRRRAAGALLAAGIAVGGAVGMAGAGSAMPAPAPAPYDVFMPIPAANWCPGGGASNQWGGYCEGVSYADGTRWNVAWVNAPYAGMVYQPMKCVVHTGSPMPPNAWPSGCGRLIGGSGPIGGVGSGA